MVQKNVQKKMSGDSEVVIARFAFDLGKITTQIYMLRKDQEVLGYFRRGGVDDIDFKQAEELLTKIAGALYQDFEK